MANKYSGHSFGNSLKITIYHNFTNRISSASVDSSNIFNDAGLRMLRAMVVGGHSPPDIFDRFSIILPNRVLTPFLTLLRFRIIQQAQPLFQYSFDSRNYQNRLLRYYHIVLYNIWLNLDIQLKKGLLLPTVKNQISPSINKYFDFEIII